MLSVKRTLYFNKENTLFRLCARFAYTERDFFYEFLENISTKHVQFFYEIYFYEFN